MGLLDDLLGQAKSGLSNYFSDTDSPISKLTGDLAKVQATLDTEGGLSSVVNKAADQGISKLATTYSANQDNSAKIQVDGSFLTPDDSTGAKGFLGLGAAGLAIVAIGVAIFLKR